MSFNDVFNSWNWNIRSKWQMFIIISFVEMRLIASIRLFVLTIIIMMFDSIVCHFMDNPIHSYAAIANSMSSDAFFFILFLHSNVTLCTYWSIYSIVRHTFRNTQVIKLQHIVLCFHLFHLVFGAIERIDYRPNHSYEWILWFFSIQFSKWNRYQWQMTYERKKKLWKTKKKYFIYALCSSAIPVHMRYHKCTCTCKVSRVCVCVK